MSVAIERFKKKKSASISSENIDVQLQKAIKDSFSLVMAAHRGIPAEIAFRIGADLLLHQDQLAQILHVSVKTLRAYAQANKKLDPPSSEQVLKLHAMHLKGEEVFGTSQAFGNWLQKPAHGLEGQVPLMLLQTSEGIDLIIEELERIAYGDFS
jgi:putative toxin-antitoxin system antitoxin component (TIGR02293 family)